MIVVVLAVFGAWWIQSQYRLALPAPLKQGLQYMDKTLEPLFKKAEPLIKQFNTAVRHVQDSPYVQRTLKYCDDVWSSPIMKDIRAQTYRTTTYIRKLSWDMALNAAKHAGEFADFAGKRLSKASSSALKEVEHGFAVVQAQAPQWIALAQKKTSYALGQAVEAVSRIIENLNLSRFLNGYQ